MMGLLISCLSAGQGGSGPQKRTRTPLPFYPVFLCDLCVKDFSIRKVGSQPAKQNAPDSFESWDVCRSALPQVLLNPKTKRKPRIGKWLVRAITGPKVTSEPLLRRDQIEFPGRFFIEQRALFCIAAAPVFISPLYTREVAC
jgi:hypothetical protein